jgi:hypothetical protein
VAGQETQAGKAMQCRAGWEGKAVLSRAGCRAVPKGS